MEAKTISEATAKLEKQQSKLGSVDDDEMSMPSFDADKLTSKGRNIFLVAVDGSETSEMAFEAAMTLKKKYDFLACFHASKASKKIENPNFRPEYIKEHCEHKLIATMPVERFAVCIEERGERSFMDTLKANVSHYRQSHLKLMLNGEYPDFIVFGAYGRKGQKAIPNTLGSNCARALQELPYPCIIMRKPIPYRSRSFLFCVNNSEQSKKGLDILLKLVNPRDSLHLVHMYDTDSDQKYVEPLKEYFESELEQYGPVDSKVTMLEKPHGEIFTNSIVSFADQQEFDFFCIAPRAKQQLSSVSNHILNHLKTSIILLKI